MAIESRAHGLQTISLVITPVFPLDWDVTLKQAFICYWIHTVRWIKSCGNVDLIMHIAISDIFTGILMISLLHSHKFHILPLKSVIPNFVVCLVFVGIAFSFMKLISSSDTMRQCAGRPFLKNCLPAIITSREGERHSRPMTARKFL